MIKFITIIFFVVITEYALAAEPLIDEYQLKAIDAHEKILRDCEEKIKKNGNDDCSLNISLYFEETYPLPRRGTDRYCKEQYSTLSVDELEAEFKKIETDYEQARFFPVGSAIEPERGEVTKGDLNSEIRCISDFIELKK